MPRTEFIASYSERPMRRQLCRLIATTAAVASLRCSDDGFTPSVMDVAGSYTAAAFMSTNAGTTTDHLAGGASFTITLAEDGTTTGRLFVPGGAEGGGDLDADMTGTWTLAGRTLRFVQTADTFVRDMPFTVEPNRLRGEATFSGTTVRVTLGR